MPISSKCCVKIIHITSFSCGSLALISCTNAVNSASVGVVVVSNVVIYVCFLVLIGLSGKAIVSAGVGVPMSPKI